MDSALSARDVRQGSAPATRKAARAPSSQAMQNPGTAGTHKNSECAITFLGHGFQGRVDLMMNAFHPGWMPRPAAITTGRPQPHESRTTHPALVAMTTNHRAWLLRPGEGIDPATMPGRPWESLEPKRAHRDLHTPEAPSSTPTFVWR